MSPKDSLAAIEMIVAGCVFIVLIYEVWCNIGFLTVQSQQEYSACQCLEITWPYSSLCTWKLIMNYLYEYVFYILVHFNHSFDILSKIFLCSFCQLARHECQRNNCILVFIKYWDSVEILDSCIAIKMCSLLIITVKNVLILRNSPIHQLELYRAFITDKVYAVLWNGSFNIVLTISKVQKVRFHYDKWGEYSSLQQYRCRTF